MMYALDSNIISYMLKEDAGVIARYRKAFDEGGDFVIPPVVYYEVSRWLLDRNSIKLFAKFRDICALIPLLGTDREVWDMAAALYVRLRKVGRATGDADLLIAAYCLVNGCVLVTNNARHFEEIDGLELVNWK